MADLGYLELPPTVDTDVNAPAEPTRVFVAVPCFGCQIAVTCAAGIVGLQALMAQLGVEVHFEFMGNESLIERARNILTAKFLAARRFSHLFFLDADIGFDPASVVRLLKFDKDVTSAVYSKKSIDWAKVESKVRAGDKEDVTQMGLDFNINLKHAGPPIDGFVKVLDTATGFLLIKRGVIERMYEAYKDELFAVNDIQNQTVKDYIAIFACLIDPDTKRFLSEDYAFCRRWQLLGGDIWADLATPLSHLGHYTFRGDVRQRLPKKYKLIKT